MTLTTITTTTTATTTTTIPQVNEIEDDVSSTGERIYRQTTEPEEDDLRLCDNRKQKSPTRRRLILGVVVMFVLLFAVATALVLRFAEGTYPKGDPPEDDVIDDHVGRDEVIRTDFRCDDRHRESAVNAVVSSATTRVRLGSVSECPMHFNALLSSLLGNTRRTWVRTERTTPGTTSD
ncbi:hypothetical protein LSAT2_009693 [Lamellibrachia satsuma]|nr:hypothetical protein LSAT2_009693 [Lamellibrachia satsuma]